MERPRPDGGAEDGPGAPGRSSQRQAEALVYRVLGERAEDVSVEIRADLAAAAGTDTFEVAADAGRLSLRATSGVAAGSGLRHYLATACDLMLTGDDERLPALPRTLPDLPRTTVSSPWRWRYHLNFCVFGYSAVYWDWPRWEREIDRMALHGVNLPLNLLGQEVVWLRALRSFGVDDARARAYVGGPAFLPWAWMGCVHDHGTPMTDAWLADRTELAHRVLERQRALGMTPVLPGFTGYVPEELAGPGTAEVDWMGFANRALDPRDPRFRAFGGALLREQEREFGSDHYYAIDPFIEGAPPHGEAEAVADVARAVSRTLHEHDPRSVWVVQGWPFTYRADFWTSERIASFLGAIPREQLLVLDLWAEHKPAAEFTGGFSGASWLWCMLHNLGGRPGMHGPLHRVATEPGRLASRPVGDGLVGVGTTMEFLDRDPVLYELFADMAWHGEVPEVEPWLRDYARRRYGRDEEGLHEAWRLLAAEVYADTGESGPPVSVVASRPRVDRDLEPDHPLNLTPPRPGPERVEPLLRAWHLLVDSAVAGGATPGLCRDVVDVGDEVLTRLAAGDLERAAAAYRRGDAAELDLAGESLLGRIEDLDRLVATWRAYLLGDWLAYTRSWGRSEVERDALAADARRLLTCWVGPGHVLRDYAGRHWAGLVSGYYLPRWRRWLETLREALAEGGEPCPDRFDAELTALEEGWLREGPVGPTDPVGDPVSVADRVRATLPRPVEGS